MRVKCSTCSGTKKVLDEDCPACESTGWDKKERSVKLRNRVRNWLKFQFEDWLEYQARSRLFRMKDKLEQGQYEEASDRLDKNIGAFTYAWQGDCYKEAVQQTPGRVKLFMLLIEDADRLTKEKQTWTESDVVDWLRDEKVAPLLATALKSIMEASPNFYGPPVKGQDD